jgi:signal transduction histidine kinase
VTGTDAEQADRRRRLLATGAGLLVGVEGIASVRVGFAAFETRIAILTLATGWLVAAMGLAAYLRAPASRVGPLVVACSAAWFIGGFAWGGWPPVAWLASSLSLAFAAVVVHTATAFPTGRFTSWGPRLAAASTYVAVAVPIAMQELLVAAVGLMAVAAMLVDHRHHRRARAPLVAAAIFCIALATHRLVPVWLGWTSWFDSRTLLQASLWFAALAVCLPLVRAPARTSRLGDLVVELGTSASSELLHELGRSLGDPHVQLGSWFAEQQAYVDLLGRPLPLPADGSGRAVTRLDPADGRTEILIHDANVMLDATTRTVIARALAASAANVRLQAALRAQVAAVVASRRRLLLAGDEEQVELERRLGDGLEPSFEAVERALAEPALAGQSIAPTVLDQLLRIRGELRGLVRGSILPSATPLGLTEAITALAAGVPVPVVLDLQPVVLAPGTARTAVFVASEALANVTKHARPRNAWVRITGVGDFVDLEIADDGQGGADPRKGTGLQGLRDRIEAMGGRFAVESPPGRGTRIIASLPLVTGP